MVIGYWLLVIEVNSQSQRSKVKVKGQSQRSKVKVSRLAVNEKVEWMLQKKVYFCGRFEEKAKLRAV
jgi:hypothetical protein